jgi:hypothetical protein
MNTEAIESMSPSLRVSLGKILLLANKTLVELFSGQTPLPFSEKKGMAYMVVLSPHTFVKNMPPLGNLLICLLRAAVTSIVIWITRILGKVVTFTAAHIHICSISGPL